MCRFIHGGEGMAIVFRFESESYRSNFAPELPRPSAMVDALSSRLLLTESYGRVLGMAFGLCEADPQ